MAKKNIILILSLIIAILLTAAGIFYFNSFRRPVYTPAIYTESTEELDNPYIGWYQMYAYSLSDTDVFDPEQIPEQESGPGLILLQINLRNYAQTTISSTALQQLNDILDAWHSMGKQLIVRFLYDWDGAAIETEPKSLSLVQEHMSQTAEIINRYSDCIYILQGIFVGSWGEMHSSSYTNEEDMLTLINHLASLTDPDIFLAVRTPEQWRTIVNSPRPLAADEAFGGSLAARLSLFNDGMLGSDTDLDTYAASDAAVSLSGLEKRPRQPELVFQNDLCRYVPNGGEVTIPNPYNDFSSAVPDLAGTHISYLNSKYDDAVLSKWRQDIYQGNDPFHGMNGYDYISRHLGYRYAVRSSDFFFEDSQMKDATLSIVLENIGFSNSYKAFDVTLSLMNEANGLEFTLPVQTDTRFWDTDSQTVLEIPLELYKLTHETYHIFLNINDPGTGYPIYLANTGTKNGTGCFVGSLTLKPPI